MTALGWLTGSLCYMLLGQPHWGWLRTIAVGVCFLGMYVFMRRIRVRA